MLKAKDIERIERYLDGVADCEDQGQVEELLSNGHGNSDLRLYLENSWKQVLSEANPGEGSLDHLLDRVHHRIREKESRERKHFIHRLAHVYGKVAAILLLPLLLAGILYSVTQERKLESLTSQRVGSVIHAPLGSRVSFALPDGTRGWLNSGSSLSYSLPFVKNRTITLEGEAWFDVAPDAAHPFEVGAGESRVKVLGTSFNVSAYSDAHYVEVVLESGKVEFSENQKSSKYTMAPSERLVSENGHVTVSAVDPSKYKAWTDGKLVFRGDGMKEVARRIERWFNVEVELADAELAEFSFRATFEDDSLEEVLKLLSMTSPISYKIVDRIQTPDGSFHKEKVILSKKTKQK